MSRKLTVYTGFGPLPGYKGCGVYLIAAVSVRNALKRIPYPVFGIRELGTGPGLSSKQDSDRTAALAQPRTPLCRPADAPWEAYEAVT